MWRSLIKLELCKSTLKPAMFYSTTTWLITKALGRIMEFAEMRNLKVMNGFSGKVKITNDYILYERKWHPWERDPSK